MKTREFRIRSAVALSVLSAVLLGACGGGGTAPEATGPTSTVLGVSTMKGILGG